MKIKIGDTVEFKKYKEMSAYATAFLDEEDFPKSGKVTAVRDFYDHQYFNIKGSPYNFSFESVARVIREEDDDYDLGAIRQGDEVLIRATVKNVFDGFIQINQSVDKTDVTKILKRKTPERFIVKEDFYNMYIGAGQGLVSDKGEAKIYTSRDAANHDAMDMHLNELEVIRYDDKI